MQRVEEDIQNNRWPVVICPPVGIAQEISFLFTQRNIPVSVHASIAKVHKVYESFGSNLGSYSLMRQNREEASVMLLPQSRFLRMARGLCSKRPSYLVQKDFVDAGEPSSCDIDDRFYLNLHADLDEIKSIVLPEVRPKRLLLFGPYSKVYAEELRMHVPAVSAIFQNNQPVLF